MTAAELDAFWRGDPARIGPVGPPMELAIRRPGYRERLLGLPWPPETAPKPAAPPAGQQFELALEGAA